MGSNLPCLQAGVAPRDVVIYPFKMVYRLEDYTKNHPIRKENHLPSTSMFGFKMLIFLGCTLPETNFLPRKIGKLPKGKDRVPTIHFQVLLLLVSQRVTWNLKITQLKREIILNKPFYILLCSMLIFKRVLACFRFLPRFCRLLYDLYGLFQRLRLNLIYHI